MNPKESKMFFNDTVKVEVNSKFPAGQGYSPRTISETHYNISLNGHPINISESAFNEFLDILDKNGKSVDIVEEIKIIEDIKLEQSVDIVEEIESLESLQNRYTEKFNKPVPPRYKNDAVWIEKALNE